MTTALVVFSAILISVAVFIFIAGTIGLLRFPDPITRLHSLTKVDNLALGLVVMGLLPLVDSLLGGLKMISVWLLVQLSGAIATQLIARVVRNQGPSL